MHTNKMTSRRLQIGVVGFSRPHFDHDAAAALLADALDRVLARRGVAPTDADLVSGLTDAGVPRLAYQRAVALGMRTVGLSARAALRARSGRWPVDEVVLVGARFGDESAAFVARLDELIRIGGGPQSRREVELFRAELTGRGLDPDAHLIEHEVAWHEPGPAARRRR